MKLFSNGIIHLNAEVKSGHTEKFCMKINEKIFDRCISNILDCISARRLEELGIKNLDEVFNRRWLIDWFKHGCPVNKKSHYCRRQFLAKQAFSEILEEKNFLICLDKNDIK